MPYPLLAYIFIHISYSLAAAGLFYTYALTTKTSLRLTIVNNPVVINSLSIKYNRAVFPSVKPLISPVNKKLLQQPLPNTCRQLKTASDAAYCRRLSSLLKLCNYRLSRYICIFLIFSRENMDLFSKQNREFTGQHRHPTRRER